MKLLVVGFGFFFLILFVLGGFLGGGLGGVEGRGLIFTFFFQII